MAEIGAEVPVPQTPEASKGLTRRNFLKKGLAVGVGAVAGSVIGSTLEQAVKNSDQGDKTVVIDGIRVTAEQFTPEGKEDYDRTKCLVYVPGFPWSASEDVIHEFPKQLANQFGVRSFIVTTDKGMENPESLSQQADALRKFLQSQGVQEIEAIVGQSKGTVGAAYLAENWQRNNGKLRMVALANPRGLNKMGTIELIGKFQKDVFEIGRKERKNFRDRVDTPDVAQEAVQKGFTRSLLRNVKHYSLGFIPVLLSQFRTMTEVDPIFSKIKAPILLFVADKDLVSETAKYIPGQTVTAQEAGSKRAAMIQTTKGRERYLKENVFTSSEKVKVLESSRMGDHLAIPGVRARQTARIIKGETERLNRNETQNLAQTIAQTAKDLGISQVKAA